MIESSEAVGRWVRASEYRIDFGERGPYIRPAPGAALEVYDPWDERDGDISLERGPFRSARRRARQGPYGTLIDLLGDPSLAAARGRMSGPLPTDAERLLLSWCRRYGLLGLAQHEIRSVTFPPQEQSDTGQRSVRWEWGLTSWIGHESRLYGARELFVAPEPGVEYRPLMGSTFMEWRREPLTRWLRYFPDHGPGREASPGSHSFWIDYGEPVGAFLNAVHNLRDVLQAANAHKSEPRPDAHRIATFFNRFVDRVHPVIEAGEARPWAGRWAAPSLIAMLAMMARDDLIGCSLHQCASPDCGRFFRSTARAVTYCSDTCRSREQKRKTARRGANDGE